MSARRWLISGRVQGVAFRAYTQARALALGLSGYAQNLPAGRVEVLAQGDDAALDQLAQWLRQGPPAARVEAVHEAPAAEGEAPGVGFGVR
ncbi:MAG: acylphosphatase [Metallibacterium sp.]